MSEKIIKKITDVAVTREVWRRIPAPGSNNYTYQCEGEVKNIGLSKIRNLLIIGALYRRGSKKVLDFIDKSLKYQKVAGYCVIDSLDPDESVQFNIVAPVPDPRNLIWGRSLARKIDKMVEKGEIRRKAFLVFDTKEMDEKAQKFFASENLEKIKFIEKNWEVKFDNKLDLLVCRTWGKIRNATNQDIKDLQIVSAVVDVLTKEPVKWANPEYAGNYEQGHLSKDSAPKWLEAIGVHPLKWLKSGDTISFDYLFNFPPSSVAETGKWKLKDIQKGLKERFLEHYIDIEFQKEVNRFNTYRDSLENPRLIQAVKGEMKAEMAETAWTLEERQSAANYVCKGTVKNTGTMGIENVYIIASIIDPQTEKPLMWDTGAESGKTMQIERIAYLDVKAEHSFTLAVQLPHGKKVSEKINSIEDIIKGVQEGQLKQQVEVYYTRSAVKNEAIKRLKLGIAYFRLGNLRTSANEFSEAIHLFPDDFRSYMNLALIYYKEARFLDSVTVIEKLNAVKPNYLKAFYLLGLNYIKLQKWREAEDKLKKCLTMDANNVNVLYNLGCVKMKQNKIAEGIQYFTLALQLNRQPIVSLLSRDSELDNVRKDPEFIELLKTQL